jgi:hypothetical protein
MVLGLGEVGVKALSQQQAVVGAVKASVPQAGLYYFPQPESATKLRAEDVNGPWGILVYHPTGATSAMGPQLTVEFILNIVQALIAAFLLSLAPGLTGYLSRVGFVILAGLLAGAAMSIEYWNWYGFPANYTLGMIADRFIGFLVVGLIAAAFVKPQSARIQLVSAKAA